MRSTNITRIASASAIRRFIAIDGALEVDLTGQVNAETARGRHIGLVGGQMDFIRAANRGAQGRSIIALQSANRERNRSRIVAKLADGIVTTPRAEADLMVTEHGIAELRGRTLAERVRALAQSPPRPSAPNWKRRANGWCKAGAAASRFEAASAPLSFEDDLTGVPPREQRRQRLAGLGQRKNFRDQRLSRPASHQRSSSARLR